MFYAFQNATVSATARRCSLAGAVLALATATVIAAHAAPLTYTYDANTSFRLVGVTDHLTGTFTINPPGSSLSGSNIVLTGGANFGVAGTYQPIDNDLGLALLYSDPEFPLTILFSSNLNSAPQHVALRGVIWQDDSGDDFVATNLTGGAQLLVTAPAPVPEPSSLVLLGGAVLLAGLVRRRIRGAVPLGPPDLP